MHSILNSLSVPNQYKDYILDTIMGVSEFNSIKRVYLFGSCATGNVNAYSDVDLLFVTDEKLSDEVICNQIMDVLPEMHGSHVYSDAIFLSENEIKQNINTLGHISRVIVKGSIDLSELLQECRTKRECGENTATI